MRTFTIHGQADGPGGPDSVRFVKEGIAWIALLSPLLWFLYHTLWFEAAAYFGLSLLLSLGGDALGLPMEVGLVLTVAFQVLVALEANDLRRMALTRRGYRTLGIIHGANRDEAELRFFAEHGDRLPMGHDVSAAAFEAPFERGPSPAPVWPATKVHAAPSPSPTHPDDVMGLFPKPGG